MLTTSLLLAVATIALATKVLGPAFGTLCVAMMLFSGLVMHITMRVCK